MNINIKDIRKNAAKIAVSYLVVFFYISGVLIIITLIIMGGYMHINLLKNLWPIRLLAIDVIGAFIVIPIVYLIAMHSKKLQIRYIKEVIESKYTYAKALRSYSDEFSKKVFALADEKISEITKLSSTAIDYDQEQWKTVEDYVKKKLEASWKKVKKMIDETSDQDTKNELYESFIEHKAEMLEHLKVSKSLYDSKKYNTINEFQKKVEVYMNAREKMIASNAERNEAYAKEQERIANEWLKFLLNNYK